MRVRELYTNYQLYVLFFLPRMRLRPTIVQEARVEKGAVIRGLLLRGD